MIAGRADIADAQLDSPLGRTSPVVKLVVALVWLVGLALTLHPLPPVILAAAALIAGLTLGSIPPLVLGRTLAPVWLAAVAIGFSNTLFSAANGDPTTTTLAVIGPVRIASEAVVNGVSLGLRVAAIACVGAVFALTTDPTRLADSLVQQARIPARFAYGALAAYQSIPRFGEDLATLRQARRIRGLRGSWHPRIFVGLLVLAIRHADRMAVSMDARAFGTGRRTHFRELRWSWLDGAVAAAAVATVVIALVLGR
ncbi:MAG TPA: energy-coupling factor transporter transmembrane component T [Candidatus Limnocylindrales bacterium]|nr:energy-coupling factor transporter transmembrane component T [Candidatus Limnocylindrales bacterium]